MDPQEYDAIFRQLDALRATQGRWIADQDPTLTRLKQALPVKRATQQMDPRTLLKARHEFLYIYAE